MRLTNSCRRMRAFSASGSVTGSGGLTLDALAAHADRPALRREVGHDEPRREQRLSITATTRRDFSDERAARLSIASSVRSRRHTFASARAHEGVLRRLARERWLQRGPRVTGTLVICRSGRQPGVTPRADALRAPGPSRARPLRPRRRGEQFEFGAELRIARASPSESGL